MAGRIPQSFIDDLLDRLDIVEVIDRRVPLKKSGRNYMACCPFHDEKTPSFSVNQEKQFYHCFGCGAAGNSIGFLMDYERQDFPQAVESLADAAGLEVPREASAFREQPQQKKNIYTILEKAADFFQQQLKTHPDRPRAVDYLKGRGLTGEIVRDFDIGYAPPGWDNLLKALATTSEERQLLIDGGMLVEKEEDNKLYDRFRDRIMFPIRDNRGRIIAFGGRVLGDDKPKYLNSPETPVFHKSRELYGLYQSRKSNRQLHRLLIVEGYMDVVALAQHGITWAAATLGTATSNDHLQRVFRQCPEVVFCFDGDDAGRKAAVRALDSSLAAMEDGRQARFLFLPQGEDPDSLVRAIGANDFIRLVDKATPLEEYLFDAQSEGLNLDSLGGRTRLSILAAPLIEKLPAGIFKKLMMKSLAQRTGLSAEELEETLAKAPPPPAPAAPVAVASTKPAQPRQRQPKTTAAESIRNPVLYAIALLLYEPRAAADIAPDYQPDAGEDSNAKLLAAMLTLLQKRPDSTPAMLIGHWYGEPWGETLQQLLQFDQIIPGDNIALELADTLKLLSRQKKTELLERELDQLITKGLPHLNEQEQRRIQEILEQLKNFD
ncbi:MAG: DNA primase [Paraglaciecola psychrophila]|jgi:DNA primase